MAARRPPTESESQSEGKYDSGKMRNFIRSRRIASLFDKVWASLPDGARTALLGRLDIISDTKGMIPYDLYRNSSYGITYQQWFEARVNIHFSPGRLAKRDDEYVKAVIAHELAHAFLMGTDDHDNVDELDREMLTVEQAAEWGYTLNPITDAARVFAGLPLTNMRDAGVGRKRKKSQN